MGISNALLNLIKCFLINRFQRVNVQTSERLPVKVGVPQGSKELLADIIPIVKLFADDTSLFSIFHDPNTSANELSKDLQKVSEWAYQWKMSFNPDQNKQAQKVIFSRKITESSHLQISFSNMNVSIFKNI